MPHFRVSFWNFVRAYRHLFMQLTPIHRPRSTIVINRSKNSFTCNRIKCRGDVHVVPSSTNSIISELRSMQGVRNYGKTEISQEDQTVESAFLPWKPASATLTATEKNAPRNHSTRTQEADPESPRLSKRNPAPTSFPSTSMTKSAVSPTCMSERRGFEPGHETEDWLAAEHEVRQRYHQHRRLTLPSTAWRPSPGRRPRAETFHVSPSRDIRSVTLSA